MIDNNNKKNKNKTLPYSLRPTSLFVPLDHYLYGMIISDLETSCCVGFLGAFLIKTNIYFFLIIDTITAYQSCDRVVTIIDLKKKKMRFIRRTRRNPTQQPVSKIGRHPVEIMVQRGRLMGQRKYQPQEAHCCVLASFACGKRYSN